MFRGRRVRLRHRQFPTPTTFSGRIVDPGTAVVVVVEGVVCVVSMEAIWRGEGEVSRLDIPDFRAINKSKSEA